VRRVLARNDVALTTTAVAEVLRLAGIEADVTEQHDE
jgi:hypothetical protein